MNKKISSLLMAATMSATAVTPAFASEIEVTEAGGTGNSKVTFEVVNTGSPEDPTIFSAYVPAALPIKMDLDGNITVPTNAVIRNGVADKAIQVETTTVTTTGDWEHTNKEGAEAGSTDSHLLSLSMNGQDLKTATFPWKIDAAGSLDLSMEAVIPQQSAARPNEQIATVAFSLDWAKNKEELNATNELDKAKMDAALKNLTGKLTFTTTAYTGENGIDISKNGDGSVLAVVNGQNATVYSEGGVLGLNSTIYAESGMFFEYKAKEMDLHGLDTSKLTNMDGMFYGCPKLTSINLVNFDTSNVATMSVMFMKSPNLSVANFNNFNTENVVDMSGMFYESGFTALDLSNFNTNNVKTLRCMFMGCSALKNVNLSNFDTKQVTDMYGMFSGCNSLLDIDLKNFNTSNVANIDMMFSYCTSLTALDLSSFDLSSVVEPSMVFYYNDNLTACYVRTQAEYDKLISDVYPAPNIKFIIKS